MAEIVSGGSILGLDNIRLDLPVAGAGSRCLAALLDYLALGLLLLLWALICAVLSMSLRSSWVSALGIGGSFALHWGYFAGIEIGTGGRSLGKMALRLRVVTAEGAEASAMALLIRNLLRTLDLLVGVPLMVFDPLARRLGDRLAGTVVVHERRREGVLMAGRTPPGWGAREVAVTEDFLARAPELADGAVRRFLAERLLERLARDAPAFLDGIGGLDELRRADPERALRLALAVEEG
ncbi:MAG TPA: RDD family protein [Thermoanaerobaculia bacterium]|nr:RDD family protein [Thermoanaerobaculia bacterium]